MSTRNQAFLILGAILVVSVLWWGRGYRAAPNPPANGFTPAIPSQSGSPRSAVSLPKGSQLPGVDATAIPTPAGSELAAFLAMAKNTAIAPDEREAHIAELGKKGGTDASRKLMALGDEDTYLNFAAVRSLGAINSPEVTAYLETKLRDGDPRVVAEAVGSLAKIEGVEAIPWIAEVLIRNRRRDDGHQDIVCTACIEALKKIRAPSALRVLASELELTVGISLHHEYGSKVVEAIAEIGDPSGVSILRSYAERLQSLKVSQTGNPKGEQYFQSKIDEAMMAISQIQKGK